MFDDKTAQDPTGLRARVARMMSHEASLTGAIRFEIALARVQAQEGLIPKAAAEEIAKCGRDTPPTLAQAVANRARVGHPMVAILDAFSANLSPASAEWLHFGVTTADVFRTVRMMQLHDCAYLFIDAMTKLEQDLAVLAKAHRATPMIGRTLGRHALPITFGHKVAIWMRDIHNGIDRLKAWKSRYPSAVASGAVGTHSVMGEIGPAVEVALMAELGLGVPDAIDSKGSTDVFADFGSALAIAARVFGRIAQELFLLQGDDIQEVSFVTQDVGSSTMPHKSNPTLCIEVMSRAREVSAALPVMLEWIEIIHERDSAQHGETLENICIDMAQILSCMDGLLASVRVDAGRMRVNLLRTKGAVLAEGVTVELARSLGRRSAHRLVSTAVKRMRDQDLTFAEAMAMDETLAKVHVPDEVEAIGLAPEMVDRQLERLGHVSNVASSEAQLRSR